MQSVISNVASGAMRGLHRSVGAAARKAGFVLELRHEGELKLGLWRKQYRDSELTLPAAKRLVLLPGFGDTPLSWLPTLTLLSPWLKRSFDELVVLDFPGFQGFLAKERACDSMDRLLTLTHDALHSLRPHTVLGHSLGGWLSAAYASQSEHSWPKRLVLVSPSGLFGEEAETRAWRERFLRAHQEGFSHLRDAVFGKEPIWFRWVEPEFSRFITREDIGAFLKSVREDHSLQERLRNLRCPVDLIWGDRDSLVPTHWHQEWMSALAAQSPRVLLLKNMGHSPQLEKPFIMAAAISSVLGVGLGSGTAWTNWAGRRWWTEVGLKPE